MSQGDEVPARLRWARLRFAVVGQLLESPPEKGELAARIAELATRTWRHPTTGEARRFSAKTIERLYYAVRAANDPFELLARKVPEHAGTHPSISAELARAIEKQHQDHPRWSYQLHYDNLRVLAKQDVSLGSVPGYAAVRRFMKAHGMFRVKKRTRGKDKATPVVPRETRSYEVPYVNALWHFDFHEGKRQVVTAEGVRKTPYLLSVLDDCSRLCCHAQWYLDRENTEDLIHGLKQAFQKRNGADPALTPAPAKFVVPRDFVCPLVG